MPLLQRRVCLAGAAAAYALSVVFVMWWYWSPQVDLQVYRLGGAAVLHSRDLYGASLPGSRLPFTYPPFAALVFVPLAALPELWARLAIGSLSAVALAVSTFTTVAVVVPRWHRRSKWTITFAISAVAALGFEPVRETFRFGQINLILIALIMWDICASRRRHRGVLVGLAAALKLTPGIFILYLVVTRRLRAGITATLTMAGAMLSALLLLPSASRQYWTYLVFDSGRIGRTGVESVWNQSFLGASARLLHSQHGVIWLPATATVLAGGLWLAARVHASGSELLALFTAGLTGLLVSPISWDHHWVWALPVAVLLASTPGLSRYACITWAAVFVVVPLAWSSHRYDHVGYPFTAADNIAADAYVVSALAFLGTMAVRLHRPGDRKVLDELETVRERR